MAERNLLHRLLRPPNQLLRAVVPPVSEHLSIIFTLARRELSSGLEVDIPWRRRLWLYRHGFTSRDGEAYRVDGGNYRNIVSNLQHERADSINEPWDAAVNNKLVFRLLFGSFPEHLPTLYGLVDDGTLTRNSPLMTVPEWQAARDGDEEGREDDEVVRFELTSWIDAHLEEAEALVLKPVHGYGGSGVLVCRKPAGVDGYDVNGETRTTEEFFDRLRGLENYLAWDFVRQDRYVDQIYPDSGNAIRVLTMWDYERDEPFIAGAAQRIGSDESAPIDSASSGGLTAEVGETGELGRAARWFHTEGEVRWYDTHPDTGVRIEGTRVPGWAAVRERVLEMAAAFPYFRRLGWDVIVTGEGEFTVLEVNAHAGNLSVQIHRPLLADPRVRRFYEHHGCL